MSQSQQAGASLRHYDTDADGVISRAGLAAALQDIKPKRLTRLDIVKLMNLVDKDGNRLIDREDFSHWIADGGLPGDWPTQPRQQSAAMKLHLHFIGGSSEVLEVNEGSSISALRERVIAMKPCPEGKTVRLLHGTNILRDGDILTSDMSNLTCVFTTPQYSYLKTADGVTKLLCEADMDYAECLGREHQIPCEQWVPPPETYVCKNYACLSEGATVTASSNIWGEGEAAQQRLKNVLRLGSTHGDPRWSGGDNSFIFKDGPDQQILDIHLGQERQLVRIGSMCYKERWLCDFHVYTCTDGDGVERPKWRHWGGGHRSQVEHEPDFMYFDRDAPVRVNRIQMHVKCGHTIWPCRAAGCKLGPVFAYGLLEGT